MHPRSPVPYRIIFFHIPRRFLQVVFYLTLTLIVLFMALTRTQVGRDFLRDQALTWFNRTYAGTLTFDRMQGNITGYLYIRNLRLQDPEGNPVLEVDSLRLEPAWYALILRTFSLDAATVYGPRVYLYRDSLGWNFSRALRRKQPSPKPSKPLIRSITSADVRIVGGTLVVRNTLDPPAPVRQGLLFDYTNLKADAIHLRGTLEWRPTFRFVDLLSLQASLHTPEFSLEELEAQFLQTPRTVEIPRLFGRTSEGTLTLSAGITHPERLSWHPDTLRQAQITLDARGDSLHMHAWRRLLPRLPLQGPLNLRATMAGPVPDISIQTLHLQRPGLDLHASGDLRGLPDTLSLTLDALDGWFIPRSLQETAPDLTFLTYMERLDTLQARLTLQLTADLRERLKLTLTGTLAEHTERLSGRFSLNQQQARSLTLTAAATLQRLNPARWLDFPWLPAELNGTVQLSGTLGPRPDLFLNGTFGPSTLYERPIAGGDLSLALQAQALNVGLRLLQPDGIGMLTGILHRVEQRMDVELSVRDLDPGPWLPDPALAGRLNLQARAVLDQPVLPDLRGHLTVRTDTSWVTKGRLLHRIPVTHTEARLTGPRGQARLSLSGDLVEGQLTGRLDIAPLLALTRYWTGEALRYRQELSSLQLHPEALPPPMAPAILDSLRAQAREALTAYLGGRPLTLEGTLTLREPRLVSWLFPSLRIQQAAPARLTLASTAHTDTLHVAGSLDIPHWEMPEFGLHAFQMQLNSQHGLIDTTRQSRWSLSLQADTARIGQQPVVHPQISASYTGGEGTLRVHLPRIGSAHAFHLGARLLRQPSRFRMSADTLALTLQHAPWLPEAPTAVDLYLDGFRVHNLRLRQFRTTPQPQPTGSALRLDGTFSTALTDTAYLELTDLPLEDLSAFLGLTEPLGGTVNARLLATGVLRQPRATGTVRIQELRYDRYTLGNLELESDYFAEARALRLYAHLRSAAGQRENALLPNDLTLEGLVRPYRRTPEGRFADPGMLDLHIRARAAHLFFFEYLFPDLLTDVDGTAQGQGRIRGDFRYPVFEARLRVSDGAFRIPKFNLTYGAEGNVTVDSTGFHLDTLHLTDATGGQARIQGDILFNAYRYFSFNLAGTLEQLQIMNVSQSFDLPFYGHIWLSGPVTLTGPVYQTLLRSPNLVATEESDVYIPVTPEGLTTERGFIVFVDSTGTPLETLLKPEERSILAGRPTTERGFLEGMDMTLNLQAPEGATVHLVFDPLVGDMISARGSGRVQLERQEGTFRLFGTFSVTEGDYLFTAGELFSRRFELRPGSTITWDGDPLNPQLNIEAAYQTWASLAGLPGQNPEQRVPLIVLLQITGRLDTPNFRLQLALDRGRLPGLNVPQGLESLMNQPDRAAEYAVSVLLTNTFLLTTETLTTELGQSLNELAFNSLSQLVATQLNRFVSQVLENVDISLGVQQGTSLRDLGLTYGIALRLLNERLIIRGRGIVPTRPERSVTEELQGEFVVEIRLNEHVSLEVFYRREAELGGYVATSSTLYGAYGTRLIYETSFPNWKVFIRRILP